MAHTDPAILALRALGERAGTVADQQHTSACAHCRAELGRLTEVVTLARRDGLGQQLRRPAPAVWERIAMAAALTEAQQLAAGHVNGAAQAGGSGRARPVTPGAHAAAKAGSWRRPAAGLAGLAAGLIIGIAATFGVSQRISPPAAHVIARIELRPLPQFPQWSGTTGTAEMRTIRAGRVVEVTLHAPRRTGFFEVWLLARNGVSMISLGDLNATQTGSFTIPAGTNLGDYSRIDVSLQPFNGSTLHAKTSVVRGSLPSRAIRSGPGT